MRRARSTSDAEADTSASNEKILETSSPPRLRYAAQSTPRRAHKTLGTNSVQSEDERELSAPASRVRVHRMPLGPLPARNRSSDGIFDRRGDQSTSSGTLIEPAEGWQKDLAPTSQLAKAFEASKRPESEPWMTTLPSSSLIKARLSLSPPMIDSRKGAYLPGTASRQAEARVEGLFARVATASRPTLVDEDEDGLMSSVHTTEDTTSHLLTNDIAPHDETGSRLFSRPTLTPRDKARLKRGIDSPIRDRDRSDAWRTASMAFDQPGREAYTARPSPRQEIGLSQKRNLRDQAFGVSFMPNKTPRPPGHLSFRQDTSVHTPASVSLARSRFNHISLADEGEDTTSTSSVEWSQLKTPERSSRTGRRSTRVGSIELSPLDIRAAARGKQSLISRLNRRLESDRAAFERDEREIETYDAKPPETPAALRTLRHAYRENQTTATQPLHDEMYADSASDRLLDVSKGSTWPVWALAGNLAGLVLMWLLLSLRADNIYREAYYDGSLPPSLYLAYDHVGTQALAETIRYFGVERDSISWRTALPLAQRAFMTRFLRLIDMPPSGFQIPI